MKLLNNILLQIRFYLGISEDKKRMLLSLIEKNEYSYKIYKKKFESISYIVEKDTDIYVFQFIFNSIGLIEKYKFIRYSSHSIASEKEGTFEECLSSFKLWIEPITFQESKYSKYADYGGYYDDWD
ncbi:MAG: hypothetical protein MJ224_01370 [archaeon]|nr:hypothetical protein [archaeon]